MSKPENPTDPSDVFNQSDQSRTTVIIGVGNQLRGDDAAGIEVIRLLRSKPPQNCLLIDAGSTPENYLGPVCHANPELIIIVDAAEMDETPGTIRELDPGMLEWRSLHTHSSNLSLLISYLRQETTAEISMIGIQPAQRELGAPLSSEVKRAVDTLVLRLADNAQLSDTL